MENFNFSRPEDQKKFEETPSEQKEQIVEDAHEVAKKMNLENTAEKVKNLEWSERMECYTNGWKPIIEKANAGITNEELKWRMPTKDELSIALRSGLINNGQSDNKTRWSWSGTKIVEEHWNNKEGKFVEYEVYFVVKHNGEIDTQGLSEYGLRLVKNKG